MWGGGGTLHLGGGVGYFCNDLPGVGVGNK